MTVPPERGAEVLHGSDAELVFWGPVGRKVRAGTWQRQAEPTVDRILTALREDRAKDAAELVEHLGPETQEVYELLEAWTRQIPGYLLRHGVDPGVVAAAQERAHADAGGEDLDPVAARAHLIRRLTATAAAIRAGARHPSLIDAVVAEWVSLHDHLLVVVAALVDTVAGELGEANLGELWSTLQAEGIELYDRYATDINPWPESFARLVQVAIEGMHAHFGGPQRRGELLVEEHPDRVSVSFAPCGSGGRLLEEQRYSTTTERHPFAWNEIGVCHYCIHCCVLQQLEPIKRIGHPGRVIDPPRGDRQVCTWTVYRDPSLVPDEAFLQVGQRPPERER